MYKKLFFLSLTVNILIAGAYTFKRIYYSGRANFLKSYNYQENRWYKKLRPTHIADTSYYRIALIGDSHIRFNNWDTVFHQYVFNAGIPLDVSEGVLNRITDVIKAKPKTVFIQVGINDIVNGININKVSENYDKILSELKASGIRPVIILVPRVASDLVNADDINRQVDALNDILKSKGDYIEVLLTDRDLQPDGVHLNARGYNKWATATREVIIN